MYLFSFFKFLVIAAVASDNHTFLRHLCDRLVTSDLVDGQSIADRNKLWLDRQFLLDAIFLILCQIGELWIRISLQFEIRVGFSDQFEIKISRFSDLFTTFRFLFISDNIDYRRLLISRVDTFSSQVTRLSFLENCDALGTLPLRDYFFVCLMRGFWNRAAVWNVSTRKLWVTLVPIILYRNLKTCPLKLIPFT